MLLRRSSAGLPAKTSADTGAARHPGAGQSRRSVIVGAAAAGAALGVPAAAEGSAHSEAGANDKRSVSYRETQHIRDAYRRMRF